jgi:hypothetical protein
LSKTKLLGRVGWLSVRQLIQFHNIFKAHKTIKTGQQDLCSTLSLQIIHATPEVLLVVRAGLGKYSELNRALQWYNRVPANVKKGNISAVKKKLKAWVRENVPIDWG